MTLLIGAINPLNAFALQSSLHQVAVELRQMDINSEKDILDNAGLIGFASSLLETANKGLEKQEDIDTIQECAKELTRLLYGDKSSIANTEDETHDLTTSTGGSGTTTLNCIWINEFNDTEHYSKCINHSETGIFNGIVHTLGKKDIKAHDKQLIGNPPTCQAYVPVGYEVCKASCGYSKQLVKPGHVVPEDTQWKHWVYAHYDDRCLNCIGDSGIRMYNCTINGIDIKDIQNIHNLGSVTCDTCKAVIDVSNCVYPGSECSYCGRQMATKIEYMTATGDWVSNEIVTLKVSVTTTEKIGTISSANWASHGGVDYDAYYEAISTTYKQTGPKDIEIYVNVKIKDRAKPIPYPPYLWGVIRYTTIDSVPIYHEYLQFGITATPVGGISTPTNPALVTKSDIKNGWATKIDIKPTFISQLSTSVHFSVWDSTKTIQLSDRQLGTPTGNAFEYTTVLNPNLSANGSTNFWIKAEDNLRGVGWEQFSVEKVDTTPPSIKPLPDLTHPWSTFKTLNVVIGESGSGETQISFNDDKNFVFATPTGMGEYQRSYKFVGDVYAKQTRPYYVKDSAGNISTFLVEIDKIDNTPPAVNTVSNTNYIEDSYSSITINANDLGSGIHQFAVSQNDTPDTWQMSNQFTVNQSNIYSIFARDLAGNISIPVKKLIDIDRPSIPRAVVSRKVS